jgi:protein-S-isoprenylcysteine O-methyltransferase Ste14
MPYVVAPVRMSRRGPRRGWRDGTPGAANVVGLAPVAAGATVIAWSCVEHFRAAPEGWTISGKRLGNAPDYLLTRGPYAWTRNPIHLAGGAMLLGWSVFFGSRRVARSFAAFAAGVAVLVPLWEERELEARFGEEYRQWAADVPRWLPRRRRSPS